MRNLLLAVVLVAWACAEGVAPTRQTAPQNATADATEEEAATLVQAPEEQAEEQEEEQEEEEQAATTPPKPFSYDEWTAEPPTRGEPKIPGPPFKYVDAGGKKEIFDRIRRLRWAMLRYDMMLFAHEAWIIDWEEWIEEGGRASAVAQADAQNACRDDMPPVRLRANDQSLKDILNKFRDTTRMELKIGRSTLGPGWRKKELDKLVALAGVYDSDAATYVSKLRALERSLDQIRYALLSRMKSVQVSVRFGYACHIHSPLNTCWSPSLGSTNQKLRDPDCADQR